MARLTIPRAIRLPFGWTVKVRMVTVKELAGITGWSLDEARRTDGAWIVDNRTIYCRRSLPAKTKRYVVAHELLHAVNDLIGHELGLRSMEA